MTRHIICPRYKDGELPMKPSPAPNLPDPLAIPDDKECRIQRWALAWSESFRHEAGRQACTENFDAASSSQALPDETAASPTLTDSQQ